MAVVGTAYVHVKALANDLAKDMESQLQPLAEQFKKSGQEAADNFAAEFNNSVSDSINNDNDINPAEGLSDKAKPELEELEREFDKNNEEIVRKNKNALDRMAQNFKNTGKKSSNNFVQNFGMGPFFKIVHRMYDLFLFLTPAIGAAGGAITQLVGGLYSMVSALGPIASTVAVLPGMYYSFAGALIATNIGLKDSVEASQLGFKAAKAVATGAKDAGAQVQKYEEALAGLGPEARTFTETLVGMSGTFQDISANIQSALLPDLTKALKLLQQNGIIDGFGRSFTDLAGVVGNTAVQIASLTNSPFFKGKLGEALQSSTTVAGSFGGALSNVVQSLVLVAAAAAPVTEEFARWIETITGNWASKATNDFDGMAAGIQKGADMAKLMGEIIGNLWGTLTGLGKAGQDSGRRLWEAFRDVTQEWEDFVNSVEGQRALTDFFEKAERGTKAVGNAFRALGRVMADLGGNDNVGAMLESLTPMIEQFGGMIERMVDEAGPALGEMVDSLLDLLDTITEGQGISAFADTISLFADALNGLLNLPGGHQVLIFLATFIGIFKASSIIAQVTGFRGAVSGLFKTLSKVKANGGAVASIKKLGGQIKTTGGRVKTFGTNFPKNMAKIGNSAKSGVAKAGRSFASLGSSISRSASGGLNKSFGTIHKQVNGFSKPMVATTRQTGRSMGTSIATGFRNTGKGIGNAAKGAASGVSGAFVTAGGKAKGAMDKAGKGIKSGFGKTMGAIGKINPFGLILTAVELLIPIFITLYQTSDTFRNAVNGAFTAIGDAIKPVLPILQNLFEQVSGVFSSLLENVGPPIMDAFSSIVSAIGPILGTIGTVLGDVFTSIGPVLGQLGSTIGGVFTQLGPVISNIVGQIGPLAAQILPMLGAAFGQIMSAVQPLLPILGQLVGTVLTQLGGMIGQILPMLGQWFGMMGQLAGQVMGALIPPLVQLVSSVLPILVSVFQSLFPVFTTLISTLLPPLINLLGTVLPAVIQFLMPIIQAVISAIVPIIQGVVSVLTGVITFLTGVFTGNWSMAWEGIKQIFVGLWDTLVAVVTGAWGILVAIFTGLWNAIKAVTVTVFTSISTFISGIWNSIVAFFTMVLTRIIQYFVLQWNILRSRTTAVFTAVSTFIRTIWNAIKTFFTTVITTIVNYVVARWNMIRSRTQAIFNAVRTVVTTIFNAIRSKIQSIVSAVVNTVARYWNSIKSTTSSVFNAVRSVITNAMNRVRSIVSSVVGSVRSAISRAWNAVKSSTTNAWNAVRNAVSNGISRAVSLVRSLPGKFKSAMGNASSLLRSVGSNIINGLVNGIRNGIGKVTSAARDVASRALNAAKDFLGIKSPSREFRKLGGFVGDGFVAGIDQSSSAVYDASKKMASAVTDAFSVKDVTGGSYNGLVKSVQDGNRDLEQLAGQRESVASKFKRVSIDLIKAIKPVGDGSQVDLSKSLGFKEIPNMMLIRPITDGFKEITEKAKAFRDDMDKLKSLGLDEGLFDKMTFEGADRGSRLAEYLLDNGRASINEINQQFRDLAESASNVGGNSSDYLYDSGVQSAKGLIDGLKSQEQRVADQAKKMAGSITDAVKDSLQIKSPSRVLASLGEMTAQGLIKGMDDMNTSINASAAQMGQATVDGVKKTMASSRDYANMSISPVVAPVAPISATLNSGSLTGLSTDQDPILTPQNQALVNALSKFVGTDQTNYFNIQKDKDIRTLATEISRELERTK